MLRSLVATVVVFIAWAGTAYAQQPCASCAAAAYKDKSLIYRLTHPLEPYTCWGHYNSDYSVYGFKGEMQFLFGGSRVFFGEPCFKGGPPANGPCVGESCFKR